MQKIILTVIMFCFQLIYSESNSYLLLQNVINGIKANTSLKNTSYPSKHELQQMGKLLDAESNINPIDIVALLRSESRFYKSADSGRALGICQLTPSTKKYLLSLVKEEDQSSCVQDFKLCLRLLNNIRSSYQNIGIKNPKFIYIVWAYNAGVSRVITNSWIQYPNKVYIQPKLLARTWTYYSANFRDDIFDIDIDYPGYRYSIGKEFDSVKYKINPEFKKIYVDLNKHLIKFDTNTFVIGCGKVVTGKDTATPRGSFRIIWKLWYSRNEGGPFGVCAMRLNYRFNSSASCYLHGTDKPWEVGSNETLGCINMSNWCATILFNNTEIGDFVYIK